MTKTATVQNAAGETIGQVTRRAARSFSATRTHGVQGVDIRLYSIFRSEEAALAFINKIA